MNEQIKEIAETVQEKYGLDHYVLKRNHIYMEKSLDSRTNYILSLELFPKEHAEGDGDYNPAGTAVIEMNLHTKELKQIIFVNNVSFASGDGFPSPEIEDVIEWVEETTGMMFGRQFKLVHEDETDFAFQATVDNMEVAPTGHIELTYNDDKQLTQFSIDGVFPLEEDVEWEPFSLTKDDCIEEIKQHLALIETPIEVEEKWMKLWTFKPFYIRNDKTKIILPEAVYQLDTYKDFQLKLEWNEPVERKFDPMEIDFSTEITYEDAMAKKQIKHLTDKEVQACVEETRDFLSSLYPDDSGKWTLTGMYPEKDFIISELKTESLKALERKIKIIIHRESLKTTNYWDSKFLLEVFESYTGAEEAKIAEDEAFEKMISHINVTPVYVKEANSDQYYLCGKVDCDVVLDSVTGEVIGMDEL